MKVRRVARRCAMAALVMVFAAGALADVLAPARYDRQFRDSIRAGPSVAHPMGTDELGRDRLSRLLHGTRVSLLLAPAAALLATLLAGAAGTVAAWKGGWWERSWEAAADLFLSLPWLFLLLAVRAALPLNVTPMVSVTITFLLLGLLGWAGPSRVVRAGAKALASADFVLLARAQGASGARLVTVHLLPNLKPALLAQFWTSIPLFILTEANLSLLGLGVMEPLPSWGGLLKELENFSLISGNPWVLAPAVVLVGVVCSLRAVMPEREALQ